MSVIFKVPTDLKTPTVSKETLRHSYLVTESLNILELEICSPAVHFRFGKRAQLAHHIRPIFGLVSLIFVESSLIAFFCLVSLIQLSDFVECKYIVVSFCLLKFSVEGKSLFSSQAPSDLPQCWVLISCSLDKPKMTSCFYNIVFRFHKYWMEIPRKKC